MQGRVACWSSVGGVNVDKRPAGRRVMLLLGSCLVLHHADAIVQFMYKTLEANDSKL